TVERNAGQHQRRAGGVDADDVLRVLYVGTHDGDHDLGLVAVAVGERRAQRTVDQSAVEDGGIARTAFTTEERTRDLARGIRPLFDVDRQGEEVDALAHARGGVGGGEDHGVAELGDDGTL